jgi:hypothetical protein
MKITKICAIAGLALSATSALSQPPANLHRRPPDFSVACRFFNSTVDFPKSNAKAGNVGKEEQVYAENASRAFDLWCHASTATPEQKMNAADAMTVAWKRLWDRDNPFNAEFHEQGALDLLALLNLTHELPETMRKDPTFVGLWTHECAASCFDFWVNPDTPSGQRYIVSLFRVVNDLRHNLKREPASEPVWQMLEDAQFSLGD